MHKKSGNFLPLFLWYSGTELNRHSHYCEQDFKSYFIWCLMVRYVSKMFTSNYLHSKLFHPNS